MADDRSTSETWDFEIEAGVDEDVRNATRPSWVPPIKAELVRAARATALERFFPFTSMNRLCFSTFSSESKNETGVAPVYIALTGDGTYVVYEGKVWPRNDSEVPPAVLETTDPVAAAETAERLLANWPSEGR